jgi:acyl-CoA reductase-like NAD-dependent aldehyde dehydrogenase
MTPSRGRTTRAWVYAPRFGRKTSRKARPLPHGWKPVRYGVNHHLGSEADVPFGGFKESGLGREHGIMGVQSYMEPQVINVPVG